MADSGSDELNKSFGSHGSTVKKRRLASSSDEDEVEGKSVTPQTSRASDDNNAPVSRVPETPLRSSDRIQRRRSKSFTMPSKQDVWDTIPTEKTPEKVIATLKPRKLVNNFTRVTHRYNYDPVYTSDEGSSLDGFLALEGESSSDSSDSDDCADILPEPNPRKQLKKHRVKNRRIVVQSSDSDSDYRNKASKKSTVDEEDRVKSRLRQKLLDTRNSSEEDLPDQNGNGEASTKANAHLNSSSDEEIALTKKSTVRLRKKRQKTVVSDSSGEKSSLCSASNDAKSVPSISSSEDSDYVNEKGETPLGNGSQKNDNSSSDSECVSRNSRPKRPSLLTSDSEKSDEEDALSRSFLQSKARKEERENLFKDFKQARSKLEAKSKPR